MMFYFYIPEAAQNRQTTRKGKQTNTHTRIRKLTGKKQQKITNENVHGVTTRKKG
jgi:hypothetical protein